MNDIRPVIKCRKCGDQFEPDMKTNGTWNCVRCGERNTNLKRHYRSVADLYILSLIITLIGLAVVFSRTGPNLDFMIVGGHALLLLITIIVVYMSAEPWTDRVAKTMIWFVFLLSLVLNVVMPLVLRGLLNIPMTVAASIVFLYLIWLGWQAKRCQATPASMPGNYR